MRSLIYKVIIKMPFRDTPDHYFEDDDMELYPGQSKFLQSKENKPSELLSASLSVGEIESLRLKLEQLDGKAREGRLDFEDDFPMK